MVLAESVSCRAVDLRRRRPSRMSPSPHQLSVARALPRTGRGATPQPLLVGSPPDPALVGPVAPAVTPSGVDVLPVELSPVD